MYAWIFRHRTRLQQVYGQAPVPVLAGERFRRFTADPAGKFAAELLTAAALPGPGRWTRRPRSFELRPMPRRVGA